MADPKAEIRGGRLGPEDYARNFADLHPPLSEHQARVEASRCLFCYDAPCIEACPTGIDIPNFIRKIATGNPEGSAVEILSANILGGTCARVCPTEVLCEGVCVRNAEDGRPVQIGQLQRHATDWLFASGRQPFQRGPASGKRVAVVGAGPAGLACAHASAVAGHEVVVFERRAKAGGLNEHGIAAYKMVGAFAKREIEFITAVGGIEIRIGQALGGDLQLADLQKDFGAVFLGIGLGEVGALGIPGEELAGVENAVDYIERLRQADDLAALPVGRDVVVIGGGSTAIDIAIQSRRLGAENVTIVYRRGPEQMGATLVERQLAQTNGVKIVTFARPEALTGDGGQLRAARFERTRLGADGRVEGTGEGFTLEADMLFKAIGQQLAPAGLDGLALEGGKIRVDADGRTSLDGVFAGGDATAGADLTVVAVEDGKLAARAIHRHLTEAA